jgi:hypothetical protein
MQTVSYNLCTTITHHFYQFEPSILQFADYVNWKIYSVFHEKEMGAGRTRPVAAVMPIITGTDILVAFG